MKPQKKEREPEITEQAVLSHIAASARPLSIREMAHETGFEVRAQWVDQEWPFVESLWIAQ